MRPAAMGLALLLLLPAGSQAAPPLQSESWSITGSTFTTGGNGGAVLTSSGFRLTIVAVGEPMSGGVVVGGPAYRVSGGFVSGAAPPVEVRGLRLPDPSTLSWDPQAPAVAYHVYRDGGCLATIVGAETADISADPPGGLLHLYLVIAENPLGETGTPGFGSDGVERPLPTPCP